MILGSFWEFILELWGDPKNQHFFWYFCVSDAPPWTILGPLLVPFGSHFGATFGVAFGSSGQVFWDSFGPRSSLKRASHSLLRQVITFG